MAYYNSGLVIFGDLSYPSHEIVHSHDFNHHLTCFRATWDLKDPSKCLAVIGHYISDNFNGIALHPIDFTDTSNEQLVAEVMDPNIATDLLLMTSVLILWDLHSSLLAIRGFRSSVLGKIVTLSLFL